MKVKSSLTVALAASVWVITVSATDARQAPVDFSGRWVLESQALPSAPTELVVRQTPGPGSPPRQITVTRHTTSGASTETLHVGTIGGTVPGSGGGPRTSRRIKWENASLIIDVETISSRVGERTSSHLRREVWSVTAEGTLQIVVTESGTAGTTQTATLVYQRAPVVPRSPDDLVQALRELPAEVPGAAPLTGVFPPIEQRRRELYDHLWSLGSAALPALSRGLVDSDVQVRRNAALFLGVAGGDWYDRGRARLDIRECLPFLVRALGDPDSRVRELAAQAVGATGAAGVSAVPALIIMLDSPSVGDRNTACIGLAGIGPAARDALPALKKALLDPSADVRAFAKHAIERIESAR